LLVRALSYSQQVNTALQQAAELEPAVVELVDTIESYRRAVERFGDRTSKGISTIELRAVEFAYEPGRSVLEDVSLRVQRGEVVGIVGPSGSGKSTLVQLLLRLRRPLRGEYLVDGFSAAEFDFATWARQFTLVPQENRLIRGTIADNIRFFRSAIDEAAIVQAAQQAHVHAEIDALPDGYATLVGSGGADLSGGQRQRLGLARAIVGEPSVIILDEPTSALDMQSEALVQQTLVDLKGRVTLLIIAHRISTLNICDRIMVLDDGRVQAFGSHEEILTTNAFYAESVRLSRLPP
jgi:ABC-type multidrug transport system fused ATPase/permease subunit